MIVLGAFAVVSFAAWWGVACFVAPDHFEPLRSPSPSKHVRVLDDGVEWGGRNP